MAIKLLVWDLDGVIINTDSIHLRALNQALVSIDKKYCISQEDNIRKFGSIPTKEKLKLLSLDRDLPIALHQSIIDKKNKFALEQLDSINTDEIFCPSTGQVIEQLIADGFILFLASNTNKEFIKAALAKVDLTDKFVRIYANNTHRSYLDYKPKPSPDIYLQAMSGAGVSPSETLVFEDSLVGQQAALSAGAHLFPVETIQDINYQNIIDKIRSCRVQAIKWHSNKINVVIPMAGEGSRFQQQGWVVPKPLIDVNGLPMVANVIKDLNIEAQFIFIVKQEHEDRYHVSSFLNLICHGCKIVFVSGKQSGAASTVLTAKDLIDNAKHLLIVNSDQVWDWNARSFYYSITSSRIDGSIVVFEDNSASTKWSYAKVDETGYVSEVAEKKPISNMATAGIYYFGKGSDFVHYAKQMIEQKLTINNEYYVAPVYNLAIQDGKKINTFSIDKFWPTGTPEELEYYLANRKVNV